MTVFSGSGSAGSLHFADGSTGDESYRGYINYVHSGDSMQFGTAGLEAMRIDSSGNVGIGTTSPDGSDWNSSAKLLHISQNDANGGLLKLESSNTSAVLSAGNNQFQIGTIEAQPFQFYTGGSEAMRIDSSGKLLVGTTTSRGLLTVEAASGFCGDFYTQTSTASQDIWVLRSDVGGAASANFVLEANGDALNTNNSYGAISDARLKKNITPAKSQLDDIMAIEVVNYDWKDKEGLPRQLGVVAQQLEEVGMSGLVSENQDGRKSVKYSVMYMKAIKALQEAVTRIETLEAEVAALKGE
jgi:hypothetical protein